LRAAIDQLDARRAQIYIEALIVEVTAAKASEFGIQWQHFPNTGSGAGIVANSNFTNGSTGSNIITLAANPAAAPPGLNLGVINGTVTLAGTTLFNLGALARALESDSGTNILSTPTLLTLDNEEAKIVVGQNIPIVTGSFTLATGSSTTAGTNNPFQTVDRRDVGLMLRVKPQVAQGGSVKMQLYEEVSSVVAGTLTNANGP